MDGVLRCSRYAFGPNRLHYCGPDANQEIAAYIENSATDPGLESLLRAFNTMYPYLKHIAAANNIRDPFDERVVEAYWIGNNLLETVEKKDLYRHLLEDQQLKKRLGQKSFDLIADKIGRGAVPHHSFHVLDVWKRTGHLERAHTLESMDSCRIAWGKVMAVDGPKIKIETAPLIYTEGKLSLGEPTEKTISRNLEAVSDIEQLKTGEIVTYHWGVACEVITPRQSAILKRYTLRHIALANQTL